MKKFLLLIFAYCALSLYSTGQQKLFAPIEGAQFSADSGSLTLCEDSVFYGRIYGYNITGRYNLHDDTIIVKCYIPQFLDNIATIAQYGTVYGPFLEDTMAFRLSTDGLMLRNISTGIKLKRIYTYPNYRVPYIWSDVSELITNLKQSILAGDVSEFEKTYIKLLDSQIPEPGLEIKWNKFSEDNRYYIRRMIAREAPDSVVQAMFEILKTK